MILSCVTVVVVPLTVVVVVLGPLLPHALSRKIKMMLVIKPNRRPCRLHVFIDCLLSVFAGHLRGSLKCCRQQIPLIGRFSCYSDTCRTCSSPVLSIPALDGHIADGIGLPSEQVSFQRGDQVLRQQRHYCQDYHRRKDTIGVEVLSRVLDQQANTLGRAYKLTYHCADQRKTEAGVQAGEDP